MIYSLLLVMTIAFIVQCIYIICIYIKHKKRKLTYEDYKQKVSKISPTFYLTLVLVIIFTVLRMG